MAANIESFALLEAPAREIHFWAVRLCAANDQLGYFRSLLSSDEADRARRFLLDRHSRRFSLARGVLRILLSRYVSTAPGNIRFAYGVRGKPRMADDTLDLRFNCSHSYDIAVYSIAVGCELGVDIEKVRPLPTVREIAQRYFCPEEVFDIASVPVAEREAAFFRCWTRKEAFMKAVGDGFRIPLNSFRVSVKAGNREKLVAIDGDPVAANDWQLHEIIPVPDYICALAYRDKPRLVRVHRLTRASDLLSWL